MLVLGKKMMNRMDFTRSIKNPNSRLARLVKYLKDEGPATKEQILLDVFNRKVDNTPWYVGKNVSISGPIGAANASVTRGWGTLMFRLALHHDIIRKTRVKNHVVYSVGDNWTMVTL